MKRFSLIGIVIPSIFALFLAGCGGEEATPTEQQTQTEPQTPISSRTVTTFGPKLDGNFATVAAATFDSLASEDGPSNSLAKVSFNTSTGVVTITDGKSVRGYEITFVLADGVSDISASDAGFIALESGATTGDLTTVSWRGEGAVAIAEVKLMAADGTSIPVAIN